MHCQEFESRLNEILDQRGRPAADGVLAAHAAECDACNQLLAGQEVLLAAVGRLQTPVLAAGFSRRVVGAVAPVMRPAKPAGPSRGWLAVGTVLAAAAAMLLAVSLVWYARQGDSLAKEQEATERDRLLVDESLRRQPGRGALAVGQSSWLIEAPRLPGEFSRNYRGTLDNLATTLPETVQRLDEVERYAPGIKPLRVSFTALLNALWRAIPGGEVEPSGKTRTTQSTIDLPSLA